VNVFVGRQPILDLDENIFAYELLYRNSSKNSFPEIDADEATIGLIVNTFMSIGIDVVNKGGLSFINFTGSLLAKEVFNYLDPKLVVIEILEDVEITPSLITKIRFMKDDGFKIAMDDFIMQKQYKIHASLFEFINYIKVDFLSSSMKERLIIEEFAVKYPHIELIAEKVETMEDYNYAKKSGYKLFQGYYFAQPEIISGFEIPTRMNLHFQIIKRLSEIEPDIASIAEFIKRDVSLSYKLLRFINSAGVGMPREISSINQAIMVIGINGMKKWMHVLTLRDIGNNAESGKVKALVQYSLTRAKMCELLAINARKKNPESYFLAGMFSLMDVITSRNWHDVLKMLPLSDEVTRTLMGMETEIKPYLALSIAVERFDLEKAKELSDELNISYSDLQSFTQTSNHWIQLLD